MHIKHNIDLEVITVLVGIVMLSGCILGNMSNYSGIEANAATSSTDTVSIAVQDACTMSVEGNNGLIDGNDSTYSVSMQGGTTSTITANSIKTFCNDSHGFKIYAIGYSNNIYGNTDLIYSNNNDNNYNIKTTGTSGDSYWKMKLENSNSNVNASILNNYDNFNVVPNDYTIVAQYNSNTGNTSITASIITPSYQIYASGSQPAGTYNGKVKYTLVHPTTADAPVKPKCAGYNTMQDIANLKSSLAEEAQTQLCDTRDEKIYWVAKLKDGNVWMTQNLDYDIKATGNEVSLIDGATTTWDSPNGATSSVLISNTGYTGTTSWDPGDYYIENGGGSSACTTWHPDGNCQGTKVAVSPTSSEAKGNINLHYHLGNYYQWNAATAGTGGTITVGDAAASVCPKGWRLPTSNSYDAKYSLGALTEAYDITDNANGGSDANLLKSPLWFVRAGSVAAGGVLELQGTYGRIWSSLANSNSSLAYRLQFRSNLVNPLNTGNRNLGFNVRCVAK